LFNDVCKTSNLITADRFETVYLPKHEKELMESEKTKLYANKKSSVKAALPSLRTP
jgi:hypothetical protein